MREYIVDKSFVWQGELTENVRSTMRMFGLDLERLGEERPRHACSFSLSPGEICFITGASGAGKSVLLRELFELTPEDERVDLGAVEVEDDRALVDCFAGNWLDSLRTLSIAGLSDAFSALKRPVYLSEGQKYRYRLARALASGKRFIFADEFCSNLDRISAAVTAFQIRKFASRHKIAFVLASSHEDIIADLEPDIIIIKQLSGKTEIKAKGKW